jgi:hypothetical protein
MARRNHWPGAGRLSLVILTLMVTAVCARQGIARADSPASPWSAPAAIAVQLTNAAHISLVYTADGVAHALWESGGTVFYASRQPGCAWGAPIRVAVGTAPTMVTDGKGTLYAVFANQFMGNYDIFYVRRPAGAAWSLPVNVSRTSGYSGQPALTVGNDQSLHVSWTDGTPGYSTIYYGKWDGRFWITQPVPNARGQAPTLAAAPDRSLRMAWQDRMPAVEGSGAYDILLSDYTDNRWSLPINISDSADSQSLGAQVTTTSDGVAHLVWVERSQQVTYSYGRGVIWSRQQAVRVATAGTNGPRIAVEGGSFLHIAWDEGTTVRETSAPASPLIWPSSSTVASSGANLKDVTLTVTPQGRVAVGWVQALSAGKTDLYESLRTASPITTPRAWLPMFGQR